MDPGRYGNYDRAGRPDDGQAIRYLVVHNTEVSYDATVALFADPGHRASSHYVLRSVDGEITESVETGHVAWHAANWYINSHSIGLEHEGWMAQGERWFTPAMLQASVALVRSLASRYGIPLDRAHVLGHDDVPPLRPEDAGTMHADPGPRWDWAGYMALLGAPIRPSGPPDSPLVTVCPPFAGEQPSSAVLLRTAPDPDAPLLHNPALLPAGVTAPGGLGDWTCRAATGARYWRTRRQGDWDALQFGAAEAWVHNPASAPVLLPGTGAMVRPVPGQSEIPIYGRPYVEESAYPPHIEPLVPVPIGTITAGARYAVGDRIQADYFWSPDMERREVVRGREEYYQIFYTHRIAFVRAADVERVTV